MTVKVSHSISNSGTFNPRKLVQKSQTGKAFNSVFFKSSILLQIALYFSNNF